MNIGFEYLKSQQTVGELRKVVMEAQSPKLNLPLKFTNSLQKGDKFVARSGNTKYHQEGLVKSFTLSLKPQTFKYTKINNARRNLEWQKAQKDLGIPTL